MDSKGRVEEAVAQYQQAARLRPDSDLRVLLGLDLEKLGRNEDAMFQFREALRERPDNAAARRELPQRWQPPARETRRSWSSATASLAAPGRCRG